MKGDFLPSMFKGFSTKELLQIWQSIPGGGAVGTGREKILAMRELLHEYKISPLTWTTKEDELRAKNLVLKIGLGGILDKCRFSKK